MENTEPVVLVWRWPPEVLSTTFRDPALQIPEPVASADSNFNRGVSPEEFRDAATKRFLLLDSCHSGKLTLPELQNIRQAASTVAKQKRDIKPGPSDMPSSAEYGRQQP